MDELKTTTTDSSKLQDALKVALKAINDSVIDAELREKSKASAYKAFAINYTKLQATNGEHIGEEQISGFAAQEDKAKVVHYIRDYRKEVEELRDLDRANNAYALV